MAAVLDPQGSVFARHDCYCSTLYRLIELLNGLDEKQINLLREMMTVLHISCNPSTTGGTTVLQVKENAKHGGNKNTRKQKLYG